MRSINLTMGKTALVDDEDYYDLASWLWHAREHRHTFYAGRRPGQAGTLYMHRVIAGLMGLDIEGYEIDHKNRNGLDNQRHNLIVTDRIGNAQNARLRIDSTSGVKGVSYDNSRDKWDARIQVNKQQVCLGRFDRFEDAVAARLKAEKRYFN